MSYKSSILTKSSVITKSMGKSKYLKWAEGSNHIRILTDILRAWRFWADGQGNPTDFKSKEQTIFTPLNEAKSDQAQPFEQAHEVALYVVYNYDIQAFQIAETDQTTVIQQLINLMGEHQDFEKLSRCDLTVVKTLKPSNRNDFQVIPGLPKPFDPQLLAEFQHDYKADLEACFRGEEILVRRDTEKKVGPQPPHIGDKVRPPFQQTNGTAVISR